MTDRYENCIEDDSLIRSIPIKCDGAFVSIRKQLVITKEEFLVCYNKWVKGEEE